MGEVVGAGLLAHVPTIMLPPETRLELNQGKEISLVPALHQLREEVFETLDYDTVVVLDSHWFTTVEFVVTAQDRRAGLFTAEELPRGMCRIPYDWRGDPELAHAMAEAGSDAQHLGHRDRRPVPADLLRDAQPVEVPRRGARTSAGSRSSVARPARPRTSCGPAGRSATRSPRTDRKVLLIASGALSHTFWTLRQLRDHEASDVEHIFTPEAYAADLERIAWFKDGDHARVLDTMPEFLPLPARGRCSPTT